MAAFNFPSSPSNGDTYTLNSVTYQYDGTKWVRYSAAVGAQGSTGSTGPTGAQGAQGYQGLQGAQAHISASAPSSGVNNGDLWWESDTGDLAIYYNDGSSSQWIDINTGPRGAQGGTGPTGAQGAAGAQGATGAAGSNASISNNADNRVITGGSGTNLAAESSFTYNAGLLIQSNSSGNVQTQMNATSGDAKIVLDNTGNANYSGIDFERERSSGTGVPGGSIFMLSDTSSNDAYLYIQAQSASAQAPVTSALSDDNGVRLILKGGDGIFSVEAGSAERLRITTGGVIQTGTKTITGGNNLAIQSFVVKGIWSGSGAIGKEIEMLSGYDGTVKMAAIGYNLTDTNTGSSYGGDLVFHTQPLYSSPTTPLPERMRISASGYVTKPNQPSFTAKSTGTWTHGSSTGYLDIDINMSEEFDVGGNYNGQIFTAPVAGKYFFSYTFQYVCTSGYLVVSLRKGVSGSYSSYGRMHVYPPQQSTSYHGPGIIGIIDLAAGNTVKPVAEVNYAGNQVANVNFSGYLLG